MSSRRRVSRVAGAWVGLVVALLGAQARAEEESPSTRVPLLPKYAQECAACHTQADQGDFNEHNVRIPR